jgi:hypothetical protein
MRHNAESFFVIEYLRKYESIFETASACNPGDPGVLFAEKTEGRKSRDTVPLTGLNRIKWLEFVTPFLIAK